MQGCGLIQHRTYATDGRPYADEVPPTGDDAIFNFEWPPWSDMPTRVEYAKCGAWAKTCSDDPQMQQYCLDGCQYWRGPSALGEQGFHCELGVAHRGASWGVLNEHKMSAQNFTNRSCVLNISGQDIQYADRIQVVPWDQPCRTNQSHSKVLLGNLGN